MVLCFILPKKAAVRWNLEGPINSGYLAHCSHSSSRAFTLWERCCEVGPWGPHRLRIFSPLRIPFFASIRVVFSLSYMYTISESYDTNFSGHVVYKPWVLSVSSEALVPIAAILIPAVDQLVTGLIIIHLILWFLNAHIILGSQSWPEAAVFHSLIRELVGLWQLPYWSPFLFQTYFQIN